jgi:cytidyltransferase-like protein
MSFAISLDYRAKKTIKTTPSPLCEKIFDHVMSFGTFDIFHPGHEFYLREAQKFAQKMTVVIARDHRVFHGKWRDPIHDENTRRESVKQAFPDVHVILGHEVDIFAPIREHHPDILAFGYDQRVPEEKIRDLFPNIEIVRIWGFETDKWKSSILRKNI